MRNAEKVLFMKRKGERSPERLRGGEAVALGWRHRFVPSGSKGQWERRRPLSVHLLKCQQNFTRMQT